MFELFLELKLRTPLLITGAKFGETFKNLDYIPGSTLRGALASLLISDGIKTNSDEFKDIFIDGAVRFGNLYYKYSDEDMVHYPLPLSRYHCKVEKEHHYLDCLNKRIPDQCAGCGSRMVNKPISLGIEKTISMHNAIEFSTQTTEEGKLFSYELICEGQSFSGKIKSSNKKYLEKIESILNKNKQALYIGKGAGRGLGEVESVKMHISKSRFDIGQIKDEFTLTLLSDAVLMNKDGTFLRTLTGNYLGVGDVKPEKAFARTKEITLWNSAADLPRETVIALAAGSCFVFKLNPSEELTRKLLSFEAGGIGIRREQGFGEVKINDKRHDKDSLPVLRKKRAPKERKDAVEEFQDEILQELEKDKDELKKVNKPSALFELIRFANNENFEKLSKTLDEQIDRDKSIFKKNEIDGKPFGSYIKEEVLNRCESDINKARAGLLTLCRFVQAYHEDK